MSTPNRVPPLVDCLSLLALVNTANAFCSYKTFVAKTQVLLFLRLCSRHTPTLITLLQVIPTMTFQSFVLMP